jgi:hypothetical protein
MHPIHSIGSKSHVLRYFVPFRYCPKIDAKLAELVPLMHKFRLFHYCTKVVAKLAEQVPLTHKFAKRSRFQIFQNERIRSTPLDQKPMFWGISDRFVIA